MPPRIRKIQPFEPKKFTVSATSFDDLNLAGFSIQPQEKRPRGLGFQYVYVIDTRAELNQFIDYFTEKAADYADSHGDSDPHYLQFMKDVERFMI